MMCDACARKPGSPMLCEPCLNNRVVIGRLTKATRIVEAVMDAIKNLVAPSIELCLGFPSRCICKKVWFEDPECPAHGR